MCNGRPLPFISTLSAAGLLIRQIPRRPSKASMAISDNPVKSKFNCVALGFA
jgi:hypothetical protein